MCNIPADVMPRSFLMKKYFRRNDSDGEEDSKKKGMSLYSCYNGMKVTSKYSWATSKEAYLEVCHIWWSFFLQK